MSRIRLVVADKSEFQKFSTYLQKNKAYAFVWNYFDKINLPNGYSNADLIVISSSLATT